ncbi:hypothetical protein [Mycobacterium lepromatosis]|uniref:hypothetical protein n=1 Tax=Mycobacterium lepromatosis TaxID=480418 RepID=UPI0018725528|nr:hypothetical protein [Mycobacterium lepromatosis]
MKRAFKERLRRNFNLWSAVASAPKDLESMVCCLIMRAFAAPGAVMTFVPNPPSTVANVDSTLISRARKSARTTASAPWVTSIRI